MMKKRICHRIRFCTMKASIFVREIYRKYAISGIKRPLLRKLHGEFFLNFDNRVTIAEEDNLR